MSGAVRYWQDLISESTWDALRRSRPLEAQSAANSGKRSYFWPDDADFAMAFRELSNDEIDQIVAHVAASPDLVSQGIKEFPEALRVLGQLRPTEGDRAPAAELRRHHPACEPQHRARRSRGAQRVAAPKPGHRPPAIAASGSSRRRPHPRR